MPHRLPVKTCMKRLSLAAGALLLSACVTSVVSPEMEQEAGAAMSQQVADQIGLYDDPALQRYLDTVGQRLVQALGETPYQFRFDIVDQFEPNAFATPGGYIYVSRGLLAQTNSEAELAGVLAHEISHVTQRHHVRQAGRAIGTGLLTLPGRAVGVVSEDLGNMINSPIEFAGNVYLSSYSRGQESEADQVGMRLAARAGYEPVALASALEGIERSVFLLTGEQHEKNYLDSHPTTPQRVADINNLASQLQPTITPPLADRTQFLGYLDGLWWGQQNPQQGVFRGQRFLSADMNFAVDFPSAWETLNTPRFVGAMEPEQGAYLALGSNAGEFSPEGYAAALVTRMRERAGLSPDVSRAFTLQGWPAHLVRYDDTSGEEAISLFYVFLQTPQQSFTFMGMGLAHFQGALRAAVMSMRPLTDQERNGTGGSRLRVATMQPGESLASFAGRVNTTWSPDLLAAINGVTTQYRGNGELMKYARTERYQPRE
ncbi:M48 family metalloprotease [Pseudohalioglobus sediminis]|uniref:M48 family metalloprotease n=1 Tax=Pseudohalioglobus sediminis TaxID=2606449 RepID=A0A5B0X4H4_9GAMM|nr:M48 family metalloprotease [Pseudohalioglobus sediminis]KAA1194280.1 M48 family metalloprotease [Pseudohalioglobus sediminis]